MSEDRLMILIKKAEPLSEVEVKQLCTVAESTSFSIIKLNLYEKQEDYLKCLKLLLTVGETKSDFINGKMEDGFAWIIEKHQYLQRKIKDKGEQTNKNF